MKKKNDESWVLFQIFDHTLERWSPVYCAATPISMHLECEDLMKKQPSRGFTCRMLGEIEDGIFTPGEQNKEYRVNFKEKMRRAFR